MGKRLLLQHPKTLHVRVLVQNEVRRISFRQVSNSKIGASTNNILLLKVVEFVKYPDVKGLFQTDFRIFIGQKLEVALPLSIGFTRFDVRKLIVMINCEVLTQLLRTLNATADNILIEQLRHLIYFNVFYFFQ